MHRVFLFHERGVKGNSRCSVAAMATFCLLSACKDAPLGQRQGGVFQRCASRRYRFNAFFASPFKALQSLRDSSPKGEQARHLPFSVTTPLVKKGFRKVRRLF